MGARCPVPRLTYCGARGDAKPPDLAIEVVWTSGGLDKREIYRQFGVRELWFWRRGRFTMFALRGERCEEVTGSEVLPGMDLAELASFIGRPTASQAIREYRAAPHGKAQALDAAAAARRLTLRAG